MANAQPAADHKKPVGATGGQQGNATQGKDKDTVKRAAAPAQDQTKAPAKQEGKDAAKGSGSSPATSAAATPDNKAAGERFDRMAIRTKLAVSEPGDAVEREADAVADRVMRAPATPQEKAGSTGKAAGPSSGAKPEGLARSAAPADKKGEAGKTAAPDQAGKTAAPAAAKAGPTPSAGASGKNEIKREAASPEKAKIPAPQAETKPAEAKQTGANKEEQKPAAAAGSEIKRKEEPASTNSGADKPGTHSEITGRLGAGQPIDAATRSFFEARLGRDLSDVRIHTDSAAAQSSQQISARAFTFGNHIAFAQGEYQPDSESGKRLLAHELAHVMQNDDMTSVNAVQRKIDPKYDKPDDITEATTDPEKKKAALPDLQTLKLPEIKARHAESYKRKAAAKTLKRPKGYDREDAVNKPEFQTKQESNWKKGIDLSAFYNTLPFKEGEKGQTLTFFGSSKKKLGGEDAADLLHSLKIPKWGPDGTWYEKGMQVDHIIEAQVNGDDAFDNYELLSGPHNGSAGSKLGQAIRANLRVYLTKIDKNPSPKNIKAYFEAYDINFDKVEAGGASNTNSEKGSQFWSSKQINAGEHLAWLKPEAVADKDDGTKKDRFALHSFTGQGFIEAFALSGNNVNVKNKGRLHGINLISIVLNPDFDKAKAGATIGTLTGTWQLPKGVEGPEEQLVVSLTAIDKKPYAGAMASLPPPKLNVNGASPVTLNEIDFLKGEISATGTLKTDHELFPGVEIPVRWRGDDFAFEHTFAAENLKLSLPGVKVDEASLTLFFGTKGLGAEGMVAFTVAGFGNGVITVGMKMGKQPVLYAKGTLYADRKLFDQAQISIGYSTDEGFSGSGILAITNPAKIKGIKAAKLTASYEKSVFKATGSVDPDIPGLKSASLGVTYDKTLVIAGKLLIDDKVPGVESAEIGVTVSEVGDKWKVAADGLVTPKLPGLKGAQLKFAYDDGFVLLEGKFTIKKGPLDGEFMAGVTNGKVNDKGEREGTGSGKTFIVYGSALIKADFYKDKLTGKLKLRLLPDGSIRVGGGLEVKDFEVFKKIPDNDELFRKDINSPKIPIPGLGFSVGSVSVGVTFWGSGFIRGFASVGPGKLTGINVNVEEFNPETVTFADLVISGGGSFEVPANAGLEIGASAHIGLSAAIVEADANIGITGKVDIPESKQPVLKATSKFKYNERTGLDVQNNIKLNIQPALEFALKGGVAVKLNLLIDTVTLWSKDWTLGKASFDLPIGITASGSLGYNSEKGLTTSASDLIKVEKPDFDKPDNMRKILDGSGPDPVIKTTDTTGQEVPDNQLMSLPPDPASQVCSMGDEPNQSLMPNQSVMPKRADGAASSSMQGGLLGAPRQQNLSEADIQALGPGVAMNLATRGFFEQRMGRDLSMVRIYVGSRADELAKRISARAFTVGNRIIFAEGEYRPDEEDGKELLAHELAHVGQQQSGAAWMVMREITEPGAAPAATTASPPAPAAAAPTATASSGGTGTSAAPSSGSATANELDLTAPLRIPQTKLRHVASYQLMARNRQLRRRRGYSRAGSPTNQRATWLANVTANWNRVPAAHRGTYGTSGLRLTLNCAGGAGVTQIDRENEEAMNRRLKIPNWTSTGERLNSDETDTPASGGIGYQVDHIVEYQLGGADEMRNLELLNQRNNGSSGSLIDSTLESQLQSQINSNPTAPGLTGYTGARDASNRPTAEGVMTWKDIVITRVETSGSEGADHRRERNSSFWSKEQIDAMDHVLPLLTSTPAAGSAGTPDNFVLLSPTGNLVVGRYPHTASDPVIDVERNLPSRAGGIAGFTLRTIRLNPNYNAAALNDPIGTLEGRINLGNKVVLPTGRDTVSMPITQAKAPGEHSGRMGTPGASAGLPNVAEFTPMSQLDLSNLTFGQGVFGRAVLHPSHPALSGLNVPATIENGRVGLFYTVDATTLAERLRIPGLSIDSATVTFGYDGEAFSVAGGTDFTIRNFGQGHLEAMVDSEGKFQLEGGFRADTRLFDRADMNLWYRSTTGFGGTGTLAITNPNKIRGVRAASVTATYDNGVFSATGTVEPNIPGVQSAGLSVRYGPDESGADSLLIAGDLALAAGIPGINGGQIHVELAQHNEQWSVAGAGDIRPNLPGVTSNIHLEYRDGIFTGELSMDYARSIFSGNITVGLTNRAVSPDGEAQTTGEPEDTLKLYGSGTLTARLTEQIQGSVGLKVRPSGDILISGSIGLAEAITVFDQYPDAAHAQRELFHMPTVSIPLVGIAVGGNTVGLALTINGRVNGHAFVGPGRLTQAEIRVEDFNPAQPESLHISGDARFEVPAEAGVDASLDAGVSLGAAIIRATAGINVTAGAAVRANASTAAHIDWRQETGLHLHADLNASLSPVLRFGVNGYAEVVADAFVTSFTLWRKDWNLAQREIGSSLALGVNVPVDYYSDGRGVVFDPNAVTFQVPELNADLLGQLMNDNGSEHAEGRRAEA